MPGPWHLARVFYIRPLNFARIIRLIVQRVLGNMYEKKTLEMCLSYYYIYYYILNTTTIGITFCKIGKNLN